MNPTNVPEKIAKEIVIHATAERVFEAIADPRQRVQWWGAEGRFKATEMESDLRPGGAWTMRGDGIGGRRFLIRGEYHVVDRPRVLEFTWIADWDSDSPPTVVRFDLEEKSGSTTVRLTHSGFARDESRERYQGWPWLLALLQTHVECSAPEPLPSNRQNA